MGESLAFRIGDVINPQDLSWNFGFAKLRAITDALVDDSSDSQSAECGTI